MTTQNRKTLNLDELTTLMNWHYARQNWTGEDAQSVSIVYDSEYQDFEISTTEKSSRKNRISRLKAELMTWGQNQITGLGYQGKVVTVFELTCDNHTVSLLLETRAVDELIDMADVASDDAKAVVAGSVS
ncbi:MAG: hypothetical protein Q4G13_00340 [Moraxella sp.]|nr:hypothetical protein [Moraxella sp.]